MTSIHKYLKTLSSCHLTFTDKVNKAITKEFKSLNQIIERRYQRRYQLIGEEERTVSGCRFEFGEEDDTQGTACNCLDVLGCASRANCKS